MFEGADIEVARWIGESTEDVAKVAAGDEWDVLPSGLAQVAGSEQPRWLRLRILIPPTVAGGPQVDASLVRDPLADLLLEMDRAELARLIFWVPDRSGALEPQADSFFRPSPGLPLRDGFSVALPRAEKLTVFVEITTPVARGLQFRVVSESQQLIRSARNGHFSSAAYAAIFLCALSGLALGIALREHAFFAFALFAAFTLLQLAAGNGHLFELPGTGALGALGVFGLHGLGMLMAAAGLAFMHRLLHVDDHSVQLAQRLEWLARGFAVFGVLVMLVPGTWQSAALPIVGLAQTVMLAIPMAVAGWAWSRRLPLARLVAVIWFVFAVAVGLRLLLAAEWLNLGGLSLYSMQVPMAIAVVMFSMTLTDHVLRFRVQHDVAQEQKEQSDASLAIEQRRRQFQDALRESMRTAVATGDLEWRAFKQLLTSIAVLMPARSVNVIASGYRGFDYLLAEPMTSKAHLCALMEERAATLKGVCRSRMPIQMRLEVSGSKRGEVVAGNYAVVPLQVARPGWGAVLIERELDENFDPAELALAAELVAMTVAAADESAQRAELQRSADIDPVTGLINRRALDARLELLFNRSLADHSGFTVAFVDLDHFKLVNDRHGHAAGDECLRAVADAIRPLLGSDDVLARYGGEEFLLLMPTRDVEKARELGEHLRLQVAALRVRAGDALIKLTVSIGIAARAPGEDKSIALVERADRALYQAKRNGRNQVLVASAFAGKGEAQNLPPGIY